MVCTPIMQDGRQIGFACGPRTRQKCQCGKRGTLLCDWKVPEKATGTCDKWLCPACTFKPEAGKDLCADHKAEFEAWRARKFGKPADGP